MVTSDEGVIFSENAFAATTGLNMTVLAFLALPAFAYLLGSVPFGLLLTKLFSDVDVRRAGSGNIGATNVRRTAGNVPGALTLLGDVAKGAVPVAIGVNGVPDGTGAKEVLLAAAALAAVLGHLFPVYLRFRDGGKGVATAAGAVAAFSPVSVLIALMVFVMMACFTGRVSVGSMTAAVALPVVVWEATGSAAMTTAAGIAAVLIVVRHHENITRLLAGKEPPLFK
jgi:glycerol-3-phosphate acyltransferase PlsY